MEDDEARAILREHGEEPPQRGRLAPQWKTRAESLRADAPAEPYDGGVTPEDFGTEDVSTAAPPPELPAERKPRRPTRERKSLRERVTAAKGKPGAKKKHPRVPVDRLISRAWDMMGGLASRVDVPLGRCLQMQAPVAGLIMEDIVKGTFADRALQPVARAEDKAEKGLALIGPPLCVVGLEMAQQLPEDQRKMREAILYPLLIESMVLWDRIAGDKIDELAVRIKADEPARQRAAELAAIIFGQVPEKEPAAA